MSPTCSIIGAMATGIIYKMAAQLNTGVVNFGSANQAASLTEEKSTNPAKIEMT